VLPKLYSNALVASLNSRAAINELPTMSDSREGGCTTSGRFNTAQFTSVGIPVTTDDFGGADGKDGQDLALVRLYPLRELG
jgi:hypothetical protein